MGKNIISAIEVKVPQSEAASFNKNTLEAAKGAADAVQLVTGAYYVVSRKQLFHAEQGNRRKSNKVFGFEIIDDQVTPISIPYSIITNMFICKESDLEKNLPIKTQERVSDSGEKYLRPDVSYNQVTKDGNIRFQLSDDGTNLVAEPFALQCVGSEKTVSARYETDEQMTANGHGVRALLVDEEGNPELQSRFTYFFEQASRSKLKELLELVPETDEEWEEMYANAMDAFEDNIKPYLL